MSNWWQFAQLSSIYSNLNAIDRIPETNDQLFIGGLRALDSPSYVSEAGITHILSILDWDYCATNLSEFNKYTRLHIQADDIPDENLLQHWKKACDFIDSVVNDGGKVFVHCAMGISRSSSTVCAYLMQNRGIGRDEALRIVRKARPMCTPNPGFMEQLGVWEKMLKAGGDEERGRTYEEWLKGRRGAKL